MIYQNMKRWSLLKTKFFHCKTLLFFSVFVFSLASSQTKRFYYVIDFKIDTVDTYKSDLMVLDINKDKNIFYSNEYLEADSVSTTTRTKKIPQPKFEDIVIGDKIGQAYSFIKTLSMNYYKYNSKKKIDWKIDPEKKKIGNYTVQKATTNFSGRIWTAWFCQEIPLPYGPYFFSGLPGLILEVYDERSDFHFTFVKNKNFQKDKNSEDLISEFTKNFLVNIKEDDWQKVQINYYKNPIGEYKNGEAYMTKDNGEAFTANDYKDMEKQIQNQIRIYNNPIELDKKIHYK